MQGNEVTIGEKKILDIIYPVDDRRVVRYDVQFKPVLLLWSDQQHHNLTHAIRVMRCFTSDKNRRDDLARLALSQTPLELLKKLGLPGTEATTLIQILKQKGALEYREVKREKMWDVNMAVYGFGPENRRLSLGELGRKPGKDWVLPEFMTNDVNQEAAQAAIMTTPQDSSKSDQPVRSFQLNAAIERADTLSKTYRVLLALVPDDTPKDDSGWVKFVLKGSLANQVTSGLGPKVSAAPSNLLRDLAAIGRYKSIPGGRGYSGLRLLTGLGPITQNDILRIRKGSAKAVMSVPVQTATAEPVPTGPPPMLPLTDAPEPALDIVAAITDLLDNVESLTVENDDLKLQVTSLSERNASLEVELQVKSNGLFVPDELVQRLKMVSKPG